MQTFALFLCNHSWAWATKSQLTWKTVNLVCKYDMWLMRVDNPAGKKGASLPCFHLRDKSLHTLTASNWQSHFRDSQMKRNPRYLLKRLSWGTADWQAHNLIADHFQLQGHGQSSSKSCAWSVRWWGGTCARVHAFSAISLLCYNCSTILQKSLCPFPISSTEMAAKTDPFGLCSCPISKDSDKLKQFSPSYATAS